MEDADRCISAGVDALRLHLVHTDVDQQVVAEVAAEIHACARRALMDLARGVGRVVLERFYRDDPATWHARGPKDMSLRRLAELLRQRADADGGPSMSAASLYRCVAVHLVMRRLDHPTPVPNLTPSHVRLVLPLPETDQDRLLREAASKSWSVRELQSAVRGASSVDRSTRNPSPAFIRTISRLERVVDDEHEAFADLGRASELDSRLVVDLYGRVLRLRERLDRLQQALSPKRLKGKRGLSTRRQVSVRT